MNNHLSDLALERLLSREDVDPAAVHHLHRCDECWERWCALHEDEGWPVPLRMPPQRSRTPWAVAAVSSAAALAAMAMLAVTPAESSEVRLLREENSTLRADLSTQASQRASSRSESGEGVRRMPERAAVTQPQADPGVIREQVRQGVTRALADRACSDQEVEALVQAGVEQALQERAEASLDKSRDAEVPKDSQRIADVVQGLVDSGLSEEDAGLVQDLLENELDAIWTLKEEVIQDEVDKQTALVEYKALRQDTDDQLMEVLTPEELKTVRERLDQGE